MDLLNDDEKICDPRYAQCAVFAVWRAITALLRECGIRESVLMGHSVGEYVALAEAGALDDATSMKLLSRRGQLVARTAPAKMVTVKSRFDEVAHLVPECVEVSAHISDQINVMVGPVDAMNIFLERLRDAKVEHRELKTERGFHSHMLEPVVDEYRSYVDGLLTSSDLQVSHIA